MKKRPKTHPKPPHQLLLLTPPTDPTPSSFSFALTRTAISQICRSAGFSGAQLSALQTLTRIAALYLQSLAASASSFANSANRTQSNLHDLINALHDLSFNTGFPGASSLHCGDTTTTTLLSSSVLVDLTRFVKCNDEIPFAKPVPRAAHSPQNPGSRVVGGNGFPRRPHVPKWLPDYPIASVEKSSSEKGSNRRDKLWEETVLEGNSGEFGKVRWPEAGSRGELPAERARVRFKVGGGGAAVGVSTRTGVCRGGKRVCCYSTSGSGEDEKKIIGFKRSGI